MHCFTHFPSKKRLRDSIFFHGTENLVIIKCSSFDYPEIFRVEPEIFNLTRLLHQPLHILETSNPSRPDYWYG